MTGPPHPPQPQPQRQQQPAQAQAQQHAAHPDAAFCAALSQRLSLIDGLHLPSALADDRAAGALDAAAVSSHLQGLLSRDAAVFLERYGRLLTSDELDGFDCLHGDYEVAFWQQQCRQQAQQLEQQQQQEQAQQQQVQQHGQQQQPPRRQQRQQLSVTAKNRRLAFMRRLEGGGEYFSEGAMRAREPLIWLECIGRHEGHPAPPPPPSGGPGQHGFANSLLAAHDEACVRARLQQQLEDEACAQSEHESDEESEQEEEQQEQEDRSGRGEAQEQAGARAGSSGREPRDAAMPQASEPGQQQQQQQPQPAEERSQQNGSASAGGAEAGPSSGSGEPGSHADMRPAAMARRRADFLQEMQCRFLEGLDANSLPGGETYAGIDGDAGLDDDWAAEATQDAEDAWFEDA